MVEDVRAELREQLGEVRALDRLTEPQLHELHVAVARARRRRGDSLAAATAESLDHVPALLRGSLRRMLGA